MMAAQNNFVVSISGSPEVNLKMLTITPEIRLESNHYYTKAWYQAIENKYPLRIELDKILEQKGIYDPAADQAKRDAIFKKLNELEIELRSGKRNNRRMTKAEGRELALQMRRERAKLLDIGNSINSYYSNTAEHYADNERFQYFIYACTVDAETGKRYWESYDHFKDTADGKTTDLDKEVYGEAVSKFLEVMTGVDKNFDMNHYENIWLKRAGYLNDKMQLVREDGKAVDSEGRLIDSEGRFINETGAYVDKYGNPVDKDGKLLVEDVWAGAKLPDKTVLTV